MVIHVRRIMSRDDTALPECSKEVSTFGKRKLRLGASLRRRLKNNRSSTGSCPSYDYDEDDSVTSSLSSRPALVRSLSEQSILRPASRFGDLKALCDRPPRSVRFHPNTKPAAPMIRPRSSRSLMVSCQLSSSPLESCKSLMVSTAEDFPTICELTDLSDHERSGSSGDQNKHILLAVCVVTMIVCAASVDWTEVLSIV